MEGKISDQTAVMLDATRRLLWIDSPAQARELAGDVVTTLGGSIVDAESADGASLPVDL